MIGACNRCSIASLQPVLSSRGVVDRTTDCGFPLPPHSIKITKCLTRFNRVIGRVITKLIRVIKRTVQWSLTLIPLNERCNEALVLAFLLYELGSNFLIRRILMLPMLACERLALEPHHRRTDACTLHRFSRCLAYTVHSTQIGNS